MSEGDRHEEWGAPGWESSVDLTSLSEDELRTNLEEIVEEERVVSYRRRVLHGKIDLIRASWPVGAGFRCRRRSSHGY